MNVWRSWKKLLARQETGGVLACFRIAVGFVILITLANILYCDVAEIIWTDQSYAGYRKLNGNHVINLFGGPSPTVINTFLGVGLLSSFLTMVGLGGRASIFFCLQMYIGLHRLNGEASGSSDIVITNALWILFLSSSTKTLSVDCWLKTRKWSSGELISSWPRYLAILQLVWMYSTTGWQKISAHWLPGGGSTALHYIFQQPNWARFDTSFILEWTLMTRFFTATTWVWESTAVLLLLYYYYRNTEKATSRLGRLMTRFDLRLPFALIGLGFHISIMLVMVVGPFSPISMTLYLCLFHPEEYRRAKTWLRNHVMLTKTVFGVEPNQ